jgi:hypothetical protein
LPEGGINVPNGDFKSTNVFADKGQQLGLHIDKKWGVIGLGLYGGFEKNAINYVDNLPKNLAGVTRSSNIKQYDWRQISAGLGPILKLKIFKGFNIEFTSKIGLSKFSYPDYSQYLEVGALINKGYTLYQTRNNDLKKKLNFMSLSALRLNFKIFKGLDLSISGNYKNVGKVLHSYSYMDAAFRPDMTYGQLIEAVNKTKIVTETRECNFNTIGAVVGLSFNFGGGKEKPKEKPQENNSTSDP